MKNDDKEVTPQQEELQSHNSTTPDLRTGNKNGHETNERPSLSDEAAAEVTGKPTVSLRKVETNRRNSRKSTGPKTATGKKRVSINAVKHGFFTKFLLVRHSDGGESQGEYDDFYAGVCKDYQPDGWPEEHWAEKIAVSSWRLRRLKRCESGQIARALAGHSHHLQRAKADDLAEPESEPLSNPEMDALTDHLLAGERRTRRTFAL